MSNKMIAGILPYMPKKLVWIFSKRYIAGTTIQDAIRVSREFNQEGIKVTIDLLANFYKEQQSDLVPELVDVVNRFFAGEIERGGFKPVTVNEVRGYYRVDAWIWRLYLTFRKIDRSLHKLVGKHYPYILPGKIKR